MRKSSLVPQTRSVAPRILSVREYRARLRPYILAIVCDYKMALDLLERTCAVLGKKEREGFREDRFWRVARPIVRQQIIALLKRPFFKPRILGDAALAALEDSIDSTQSALGRQGDIKVAVTQCINALSADARRLLRMRYWNGMSAGEVAGWIGKSPDEVKGMIGRTKAQLADCVAAKIAS